MNNEESLAALCFNRGCSNLGVLSPVYEVMSNFLSNEAKVLTFDSMFILSPIIILGLG